jgi:hypothetical protein
MYQHSGANCLLYSERNFTFHQDRLQEQEAKKRWYALDFCSYKASCITCQGAGIAPSLNVFFFACNRKRKNFFKHLPQASHCFISLLDCVYSFIAELG